MELADGVARPVALAALGQRYRCYRLADPLAEAVMAASLRRWGQLSPVVACRRGAELELLDGFKRWTAARQVAGLTTLSVRELALDERTAKAAILGLNRGHRIRCSFFAQSLSEYHAARIQREVGALAVCFPAQRIDTNAA